jgi:hypothetical protein
MWPFTIAEITPTSSSRIYFVFIAPATPSDDDMYTTCGKQIAVDTKCSVADMSEHERVCQDATPRGEMPCHRMKTASQ